ncbi:hypothetical protein JCM11491_003780 [Sporobolomyces phaffii]
MSDSPPPDPSGTTPPPKLDNPDSPNAAVALGQSPAATSDSPRADTETDWRIHPVEIVPSTPRVSPLVNVTDNRPEPSHGSTRGCASITGPIHIADEISSIDVDWAVDSCLLPKHINTTKVEPHLVAHGFAETKLANGDLLRVRSSCPTPILHEPMRLRGGAGSSSSSGGASNGTDDGPGTLEYLRAQPDEWYESVLAALTWFSTGAKTNHTPVGETSYANDPARTAERRQDLLDDFQVLFKPFLKSKVAKQTGVHSATHHHEDENGIKMQIYLDYAQLKDECGEEIRDASKKMITVLGKMATTNEWQWALDNLTPATLYPRLWGISADLGSGPGKTQARSHDKMFYDPHLQPIWTALALEIAIIKRDHNLRPTDMVELTDFGSKLLNSTKLKTREALAKTELFSDINEAESLRSTMSRYGIMQKIEEIANDMDRASLPDSTEDSDIFAQAGSVLRQAPTANDSRISFFHAQIRYGSNLEAGRSMQSPLLHPGRSMPTTWEGRNWEYTKRRASGVHAEGEANPSDRPSDYLRVLSNAVVRDFSPHLARAFPEVGQLSDLELTKACKKAHNAHRQGMKKRESGIGKAGVEAIIHSDHLTFSREPHRNRASGKAEAGETWTQVEKEFQPNDPHGAREEFAKREHAPEVNVADAFAGSLDDFSRAITAFSEDRPTSIGRSLEYLLSRNSLISEDRSFTIRQGCANVSRYFARLYEHRNHFTNQVRNELARAVLYASLAALYLSNLAIPSMIIDCVFDHLFLGEMTDVTAAFAMTALIKDLHGATLKFGIATTMETQFTDAGKIAVKKGLNRVHPGWYLRLMQLTQGLCMMDETCRSMLSYQPAQRMADGGHRTYISIGQYERRSMTTTELKDGFDETPAYTCLFHVLWRNYNPGLADFFARFVYPYHFSDRANRNKNTVGIYSIGERRYTDELMDQEEVRIVEADPTKKRKKKVKKEHRDDDDDQEDGSEDGGDDDDSDDGDVKPKKLSRRGAKGKASGGGAAAPEYGAVKEEADDDDDDEEDVKPLKRLRRLAPAPAPLPAPGPASGPIPGPASRPSATPAPHPGAPPASRPGAAPARRPGAASAPAPAYPSNVIVIDDDSEDDLYS